MNAQSGVLEAAAIRQQCKVFDFARKPKVSAQRIHELATGDYIAKAAPIILIGDSGAGKTHLSPAWRSRPAGRSVGCASPAPPG